MEGTLELLGRLPGAVGQLFMNPLYYVGVILIVLQYRRQIRLERKLFSARMHSLLGETGRAVLWGLAGGFVASFFISLLGAALPPEAVWLLWAAAFIMILFRIRFMCMAYSVGAVGMAAAVASLIPGASAIQGIGPLLRTLQQVDVASLLVIVGVLHLVEALLIRTQGTRMATPMFYESKRGKIVGGYQLQGFWPVPLFLVVPLIGGSAHALPWSTLLGGDILNSGWTLLPLPYMIGFTELTLSGSPRRKTRLSSLWLTLYSAAVLLLALAVHAWGPLAFIASLLCIVLHETLIWLSQWVEEHRAPYYVHNDKGLKVLAVLPGSSAADLGIEPGEIISKVNGQRIYSRADLHLALRINSAFCKLEVLNLQGEVKFLGRPLYAGEHHLLGLLLAPDDDTLYYMEMKQPSLFGFIRGQLTGLMRNQPWSASAENVKKDLS